MYVQKSTAKKNITPKTRHRVQLADFMTFFSSFNTQKAYICSRHPVKHAGYKNRHLPDQIAQQLPQMFRGLISIRNEQFSYKENNTQVIHSFQAQQCDSCDTSRVSRWYERDCRMRFFGLFFGLYGCVWEPLVVLTFL